MKGLTVAPPGIEKLVRALNARPQPREFKVGDAIKLLRYYDFRETNSPGSHSNWQRDRHYVSINNPRRLTAKEVQKLRDAINDVRLELGE